MSDGELAFADSYLSPNTDTGMISQVRVPDGTTELTYAHMKQWTDTLKADANGNCVILMLPFVECPFAVLDTYSKSIVGLTDPTISQTFMADNRMYGFRQTCQAMTVYNDTAELYRRGSVTAALVPPILDVKTQPDTGLLFPFDYLRVLDGIPADLNAMSSARVRSYVGRASEGIYLVNRSSDSHAWHLRGSDKEKASYSPLNPDGNGVLTERHNYLAFTLGAGEIPTKVLDSDGNPITVSGTSGAGMSVGISWFYNLDAETTLTLKMIHGLEFRPKFESPMISQCQLGLPRNQSLLDFLDNFHRESPIAFPAKDNFLGAILSMAIKAAPYLIPLVEKVAPHVWKYVKEKLGKKDSPKPNFPPAKPLSAPPARSGSRQNGSSLRGGRQLRK